MKIQFLKYILFVSVLFGATTINYAQTICEKCECEEGAEGEEGLGDDADLTVDIGGEFGEEGAGMGIEEADIIGTEVGEEIGAEVGEELGVEIGTELLATSFLDAIPGVGEILQGLILLGTVIYESVHAAQVRAEHGLANGLHSGAYKVPLVPSFTMAAEDLNGSKDILSYTFFLKKSINSDDVRKYLEDQGQSNIDRTINYDNANGALNNHTSYSFTKYKYAIDGKNPYTYYRNIPEISLNASNGVCSYSFKEEWSHKNRHQSIDLSDQCNGHQYVKFDFRHTVNQIGMVEFWLSKFDDQAPQTNYTNYIARIPNSNFHVEDHGDDKLAVRIKDFDISEYSHIEDLRISVKITASDNLLLVGSNEYAFPDNWDHGEYPGFEFLNGLCFIKEKVDLPHFENYYVKTKGMSPVVKSKNLFSFAVHDYQPKGFYGPLGEDINTFPVVHSSARTQYDNNVIVSSPDLGKTNLRLDILWENSEEWKKIDYIELNPLNGEVKVIVDFDDYQGTSCVIDAYYNNVSSMNNAIIAKNITITDKEQFGEEQIISTANNVLQFDNEGGYGYLLLENVPVTGGDVLHVTTYYKDKTLSKNLITIAEVPNAILSRAYYTLKNDDDKYLGNKRDNIVFADTGTQWLVEHVDNNVYRIMNKSQRRVLGMVNGKLSLYDWHASNLGSYWYMKVVEDQKVLLINVSEEAYLGLNQSGQPDSNLFQGIPFALERTEDAPPIILQGPHHLTNRFNNTMFTEGSNGNPLLSDESGLSDQNIYLLYNGCLEYVISTESENDLYYSGSGLSLEGEGAEQTSWFLDYVDNDYFTLDVGGDLLYSNDQGALDVDDRATSSDNDEFPYQFKLGKALSLDANLIANYKLDTDANDYSGYDRNGSFAGGAGIVDDSIRGQVAYFPGTNGAGFDMNFNFHPDDYEGKMTAAFWFKGGEFTHYWYRLLSSDAWAFDLNTEDKFYMQFKLNDYNVRSESLRSPRNMDTDTWHHVVGTIDKISDGSYTIALYIDGVLMSVENKSDLTTLNSRSGSTTLIGSNYDPSANFKGFMDDVKFWSKSLTAIEVRELYNDEKVAIPTISNLALNKSTSQISTWYNKVSSKAVDGDTNGVYTNNSVTHTTPDSDVRDWWQVDLGAVADIETVNIFNRTDCCSDRLTNFNIYVSENPFSGNTRPSGDGVHSFEFLDQAGSPSEININERGRYVRVQLNGTSAPLSLAEVQVFGTFLTPPPTNLALNKPTTQISTWYNKVSSKAVDGDTNGVYTNNSVTHTTPNSNVRDWWQVDLGAVADIETVNIFNRTDCCSDRLTNFNIYVSENPFSGNTRPSGDGVHSFEFLDQVGSPSEININERGRYVRVQLNGTSDPLSLAEVQVFGALVSIPAAPSNLAGTIVSTKVNLTWDDNSNNEEGFKIERSIGGATFTQIGAVDANVTMFSDDGLNLGTTYTYRVIAYNSQIESPYSNSFSAATAALVNLALNKSTTQISTRHNGVSSRAVDGNTNGVYSNNSVTHTTPNSNVRDWWQVDLGAVANIETVNIFNRTDVCCSNRLTNFNIYVSENPFSGNTRPSGDGVHSFEFLDQAGSPSEININERGRYVRVQLNGTSDPLNLAEVQVFGALVPTPAAPSNLAGYSQDTRTIDIAWEDNSNIEDGFKIERRSLGDDQFTQINVVDANTSTYSDEGLSFGKTYAYRVTAYNSAGNAPYSNIFVGQTLSGDNLAFNKPATQILTSDRREAEKAVDGNTSGEWSDDSLSDTGDASQGQNWWEVDLQAVADISVIEIWNRTDCCSEKLSNFMIYVSEDPFSGNDHPSAEGVNRFPFSGQAGTRSTIEINKTGRYVRIQHNEEAKSLTLAEVKVFGTLLPSVVPIAPSNLTNADVSRRYLIRTIGLSWEDNSDNESGFKIERRIGSGNFEEIARVGSNITTYDDYNDSEGWASWGMSLDTPYAYRVRAYNLEGDSSYSNTTTITITTTNLALNRPTTQISTYNEGTPDRAVDGNTDGDWANNSVSRTRYNGIVKDWWQVDLGAIADITTIDLWNRTDCCSHEFSNFAVFISEDPFTLDLNGYPIDDVSEFGFDYEVGSPSTMNINTRGRYVRIRLKSTQDVLSLAEVQVFGAYIDVEAMLVPPSNVTGTIDSNTSTTINVSWGDNTNNEDGFKIERSAAGGAFEEIATVDSDITAYADQGLNRGTTYTYRIRAYNSEVDSRYSNSPSITIPAVVAIINLALSKPTSQISTGYNGFSRKAVDGDTNGAYFGNNYSVTHTTPNSNVRDWWQVDLGAVADIETVNIFNRTDCCSDRLTNFNIYVSENPFSGNTRPSGDGVHSFEFLDQVGSPSEININERGRYVRVQLNGTSAPLSLAEVEVYGHFIGNQQASKSTKTSTTSNPEDLLPKELTIYPNPVDDLLNIRSKIKITKIALVSMNVGVLQEHKAVNAYEMNLDVSMLRRGLYILRIHLEDGQVINHRIVKNE